MLSCSFHDHPKKKGRGSYLANHRAPATVEILCHQPPACLETVPTLQISSVFTWILSPVSMPQLPGSFTIEIHRIQQEIIATVEAVLATASCPRMYGSVWMEPWMFCMEINVTLCYLLSQLEIDRSESTNLHFNVKPTFFCELPARCHRHPRFPWWISKIEQPPGSHSSWHGGAPQWWNTTWDSPVPARCISTFDVTWMISPDLVTMNGIPTILRSSTLAM